MSLSACVLLLDPQSKNQTHFEWAQKTLDALDIAWKFYDTKKKLQPLPKVAFCLAIGSQLSSLQAMRQAWPSVLCLWAPVRATHHTPLNQTQAWALDLELCPGPSFALGRAGAINAALFAASALAIHDSTVRRKLTLFRKRQTAAVLENPIPGKG